MYLLYMCAIEIEFEWSVGSGTELRLVVGDDKDNADLVCCTMLYAGCRWWVFMVEWSALLMMLIHWSDDILLHPCSNSISEIKLLGNCEHTYNAAYLMLVYDIDA